MDFTNQSGLEFTDISSEEWREYQFENHTIRIYAPLWLNVSKSGGHRVFDAEGFSYYVMPTWLILRWKAKEGQPHFVK